MVDSVFDLAGDLGLAVLVVFLVALVFGFAAVLLVLLVLRVFAVLMFVLRFSGYFYLHPEWMLVSELKHY